MIIMMVTMMLFVFLCMLHVHETSMSDTIASADVVVVSSIVSPRVKHSERNKRKSNNEDCCCSVWATATIST
jgi:hypothetical protein